MKHFMTCLYYANISKPNTLWIILSKRFHSGTSRLIFMVHSNLLTFYNSMPCCSFWQARCSSFVLFLSNQLSLKLGGFSATLILYQNKQKNPTETSARKVSVTAPEVNLLKLYFPCISISLSNSMGKPEHGIYVISIKVLVLFLSQNSCILA